MASTLRFHFLLFFLQHSRDVSMFLLPTSINFYCCMTVRVCVQLYFGFKKKNVVVPINVRYALCDWVSWFPRTAHCALTRTENLRSENTHYTYCKFTLFRLYIFFVALFSMQKSSSCLSVVDCMDYIRFFAALIFTYWFFFFFLPLLFHIL